VILSSYVIEHRIGEQDFMANLRHRPVSYTHLDVYKRQVITVV